MKEKGLIGLNKTIGKTLFIWSIIIIILKMTNGFDITWGQTLIVATTTMIISICIYKNI